MMLGRQAGLKGRAARAGKPALALDPGPPTQQRADMPFASGVSGSGCHLYFAGGVTFQPCADSDRFRPRLCENRTW